jgi:hypothetical protein
LIGITFISISRAADDETVKIPKSVSKCFESLVGVFMLFLGIYGISRAWEKRAKESEVGGVTVEEGGETSTGIETEAGVLSYPDMELGHVSTNSIASNETEKSPEGWLGRLTSTISTRTMALFAGIVHGLAGPGGVLGVIPAVQLHNWRLATVYLTCFCASSTVTMGVFAILFGSFSRRVGQSGCNSFVIEVMSACLSIVVGITWLLLISIGKLDDVLP